ncbi:MAG TPA: carboxypeptidase-like regulatory domain-containing protein [Acidimicrobiales bacterium]|nr:carboxypeptidase-like regulatory domain-containing protein [Acidimicrobiales bacterium]
MLRPRLLVAIAALVVLAGCQAKAVEPLPPAPSLPPTTTTTIVDYSGVALAGVPGRTTTTVAIGPGRATLQGVVTGPDGPVAGAVVHAERLVGEAMATKDVVSGADGRFTMPNVLGGRYRLRAWKQAPDNLSLLEPQVFFLEGSEKKDVSLTVNRYQGVSVTAAIAPDPPLINTASNLVVQAVDRSVGPDGIVRSAPVPGVRAELFGTGDWRVLTEVATATDGAGRARWTLECRRVGDQPLSVVIGESATFNLNLPDCTVPPPNPEDAPMDEEAPTTTAAATPTPSSTTTTAAPRPTSTTATTTTTRSGDTTSTTR